ncbi:MAG TPA: glycogen synthase GlgA [Pirellulaceae bacterium]|nr:glycogen synthase GlgA [Pirellulaceae bacterium]
MKIVFASSEVAPFSKSGGLADVSAALPAALEKLGHQTCVFTPGYRGIVDQGHAIQNANIEFTVPVGSKQVAGRLLLGRLPGTSVPVYFVDQPEYFDRPGLYGDDGRDYEDNCARFVFFCRAILEATQRLGLKPDVIHSNDWQTGLLGAYLKTQHAQHEFFRDTAVVFTIHNLAYQGLFWHWDMLLTGLDWELFNWRQMEYFGQLNLMKTGIVFADALTTVSPTYALEIQGEEQGFGLQQVLQHRRDYLIGILNGIDTEVWNPTEDVHLAARFDRSNWRQGKSLCKQDLQRQLSLAVEPGVPLIGSVGRLASQKGWALLLPVMRHWLSTINAQWVVLGTGQAEYESALRHLQRTYPHKLSVQLQFSDALAHRIEAGADMFVMPSRYEPCGLNQMYSMAYGTVPVVRRTGGLADTVVEASRENLARNTATGFLFSEYRPEALEQALARAVHCYLNDPHAWGQLVETGMSRDWSWSASAHRYQQVYARASVLRKSDGQRA